MFLRIEEAEKLKNAYASWIGKRAHIGNGVTSTLQSITIKEKASNNKNGEKLYHVEFEFENERKFGAVEFLFRNNLREFSWFNLQRPIDRKTA